MEDFTILGRLNFRERLRTINPHLLVFNIKLAGGKPGLKTLTVIFPCFWVD
jgi:hypothetical protein